MRRANILVGLALVAGLCGSIALARPMELNWDMLAPAPEPYDNPFGRVSVYRLCFYPKRAGDIKSEIAKV